MHGIVLQIVNGNVMVDTIKHEHLVLIVLREVIVHQEVLVQQYVQYEVIAQYDHLKL